MVLQLRPAPTWFTQNIDYTSLHPVPSVGRPKEEQLRCLSLRYILFRFINIPCPPPHYVLHCITEQLKSLNFVCTNRNTGAYLRNSVEY